MFPRSVDDTETRPLRPLPWPLPREGDKGDKGGRGYGYKGAGASLRMSRRIFSMCGDVLLRLVFELSIVNYQLSIINCLNIRLTQYGDYSMRFITSRRKVSLTFSMSALS